MKMHHSSRCGCRGFLPPYVIEALHRSADGAARDIAFETVQADVANRTRRTEMPLNVAGRSLMPGTGPRRRVYDMATAIAPLPGTLVREEGDGSTGDADIDQAFDNAGITYRFYKNVMNRESIDNAGYPLVSCVRYGVHVTNAFWDGQRMIYGAGDGQYFKSFTGSLAIAAHEFTHGVVSCTSNLAYQGQSGALNESFCDVMGVTIQQWHAGHDVSSANWMLGGEVFGPALAGLPGIRTFTSSRAFDGHPLLGSDPQPKRMQDYVDTTHDNGGVHLNSGIPNHAYFLAAMQLGGIAWERSAKIWYDAFTAGGLGQQASFVDAANATLLAARRLFGDGEASIVAEAWRAVGVEPEV